MRPLIVLSPDSSREFGGGGIVDFVLIENLRRHDLTELALSGIASDASFGGAVGVAMIGAFAVAA